MYYDQFYFTDRLLPCAHCGQITPEVFHTNYFGDSYVGDKYMAECKCGIETQWCSASELIELWNRRPTNPEYDERSK